MSWYREYAANGLALVETVADYSVDVILTLLTYVLSPLPLLTELPSAAVVFLNYLIQALSYLDTYFPVSDILQIILYFIYFESVLLIFRLTKHVFIFIRSTGTNF